MSEPTAIAVGERIKSLRLDESRRWTRERLAGLIGVAVVTLRSWEEGRCYPNPHALIALRKIFGMSIDELLTGDTKLPSQASTVRSA